MKTLKQELESVNKDLKLLSKKVDKLTADLDKTKKTGAKRKIKKAQRVMTAQSIPVRIYVEDPVKLKEVTSATKAFAKSMGVQVFPKKQLTALDSVMHVIKKYRKGIQIDKLSEMTGYDQKRLFNIVYKAKKAGKIKRGKKGVYIKG